MSTHEHGSHTNHEADHHKEKQDGHEPTAASNSWLKKTKDKLVRWGGHLTLATISETLWHMGSSSLAAVACVRPAYEAILPHYAKVPALASKIALKMPEINQAIAAQQLEYATTGGIEMAAATYLGGQGLKHAGWGEKMMNVGLKSAVAASYLFSMEPMTHGLIALGSWGANLISQRLRK